MSFVIDAFRKYIKIPSASCGDSTSKPTTPEQVTLAAILAEDMKQLGISDTRSDALGYAYGSIPANCEGQPAIGLIAHLDVVDDAPCSPMNERVIENYDGSIVKLNDTVFIDPEEYSGLKTCVGKDIIVTDGTTILGADDKAGVAIILAAAKRMLEDPSIKHGDIKICFTPDEEVGGGADDLDIPAFGADFAYTVDGGGMGEIEYENFNAASAKVEFTGVLIHPGSAKNRMKNASLMAADFMKLLPENEIPAHTENREGFYHLDSMQGTVDSACLKYILRDHDWSKLTQRKRYIEACAALINAKYGEGSCRVEIRDSYRNMADVLADRMDIVERAKQAYITLGEEFTSPAVRGGTDGARLSWRGLPCPNLSTGGFNGHSVREFACVQDMEKMVDVVIEIVRAR